MSGGRVLPRSAFVPSMPSGTDVACHGRPCRRINPPALRNRGRHDAPHCATYCLGSSCTDRDSKSLPAVLGGDTVPIAVSNTLAKLSLQAETDEHGYRCFDRFRRQCTCSGRSRWVQYSKSKSRRLRIFAWTCRLQPRRSVHARGVCLVHKLPFTSGNLAELLVMQAGESVLGRNLSIGISVRDNLNGSR